MHHIVTSFLMHEGKVLILKRSEKVSTFKGKWAGISGRIEEGESDLEAAYREIKEELGIEREQLEFVSRGELLKVVGERVWIVHPFLFRAKTQQIKIDWEHTEYRWIRPEDLERYDTVAKLKEALESVLSSQKKPSLNFDK